MVGKLQHLFRRHGYEPVELPALELYDPDHPLAERAFKLVDKTGEVLALRSEFTTLLAKLLRAHLGEGAHRFQYAGPLWLREADAELGRLREYTQVGLELLGATGPLADAEVLELAFAALEALGVQGEVEVGLPSLVGEVLKASGLPEALQRRAQQAIHRKNLPELKGLLAESPVPEEARKVLLALPDLYGGREVLKEARGLPLPPKAQEALAQLERTLDLLGRPVLLDLGMARRYEYYSGIFFRAYTPGFGLPLLGGGRYDGALFPKAAGFALGVERLLRALRLPKEEEPPEVLALDLKALRRFARERRTELFHGEDPVAYARRRGIPFLARGRSFSAWRRHEALRPHRGPAQGADVPGGLRGPQAGGLGPPRGGGGEDPPSRKGGGVALLELRNKDVPIYVDLGIAEIGVVGKDVLLDSGRDLFEPVDLGFGACRLSLIRRPGDTGPIRRVATKYPNFTARLLKERGWAADVVELSGNIELAAVTGLADAVVDVVQTGATLRAAGLVEVEVLAHSTARLVVNRQALKLKRAVLKPLIQRLRELSGS